jgi:hypothetical protein
LIVAPVKFPGDHVNVPPGILVVAVNVAVCPEHIVVPDTVIVGEGLIVIVTGTKGEGHPVPCQVNVTKPFPALFPAV